MALNSFQFVVLTADFLIRVEWVYSCVKIWRKDVSDRVNGTWVLKVMRTGQIRD